MMPPTTDQDRREFYRVSCRASIEIQPIHENNLQREDAFQYLSTLFDLPPAFELHNELQKIEQESQIFLRQIQEKDKNLAQYLKSIDKKIDLLAQTLLQQQLPGYETEHHLINLSEGGLKLRHSTPYPENQIVALKLILIPQATVILSFCKVILCKKTNPMYPDQGLAQNQFTLRLEFLDMDPRQQQFLARFITQQQRQDLQRHSENKFDEE
ncbi:hypothetical protein OLMES_2069 [Oleiphilus messinensis]|uniref:PilZ domain-containing protein n=1 Tax=Oleiphilus messinensis TaxID=141451 RepID=A0A1Y0I6M5_9GAMM|nr:PilZ domain-containing protein [Oleiphilus messinensis]ARU56142.1 hypothetical protein OLMES_2069 [Oleiphilus messinensis]